ncbi:phenylacetate--CoA ligase family protein [Aquibaculum sediminis]|uniref:phenylacetate--CoA ligase family protein n=1 Tax=Aquibaculum sediminis TaxID=3231907 RepID=UPI0034517878
MTDAPRPHSETVWDAAELWPRERIEAHQLERLQAQVARLATDSPFYARRFREIGFAPGDLRSLDDLRKLPVTRKQDYLQGLETAPPWGELLAVDPAEVVRVHFSSGTTSQPTPACWTAHDLDRWTDLYARYLYAQGLRRTDVFQCLFSYAWFVGGLGATAAATAVGATVIPGGSGDSKRQVESIFRFGTTAVIGTPSFLAHLVEVATEMGHDLRQSPVRMLCLGGEPGASIPATRARLEEAWGAKTFDCYGSLESQPIGWDTAAQSGPTLAEDFIYAEILDPETMEPVPDGERGVLVVSHLDKQAGPLLRWWTGDIVVRDSRPAPDGRTHARLPGGVLSRADDMLIVRGVNVFPTAIEDVIRSHPGATGEYRIIVDDSLKDPATGFLTGLKLTVEAQPDAPQDFGAHLAARIRDHLTVRAAVEVVEAGSLPRAVHKAKRLLRS